MEQAGLVKVTWGDIDAFQRVRRFLLQQTEIDYIMKINQWSVTGASRARAEEE